MIEKKDSVILFVGESACAAQILDDLQSRGEKIGRDAFGHIKLDAVNAGEWFASQFGKRIGAEKTLVQKSGYFARSSAPNGEALAELRGKPFAGVDRIELDMAESIAPDLFSARLQVFDDLGCAGAFADEKRMTLCFLDISRASASRFQVHLGSSRRRRCQDAAAAG